MFLWKKEKWENMHWTEERKKQKEKKMRVRKEK